MHKELRENSGGTSYYATAEPSAGEGDAKKFPAFSGGEPVRSTADQLSELLHALVGGDDSAIPQADNSLNHLAQNVVIFVGLLDELGVFLNELFQFYYLSLFLSLSVIIVYHTTPIVSRF